MKLGNLSQEELIKKLNMLENEVEEQRKKIQVLTEQLDWYQQQVRAQQKKLFGSSSEKNVLPEQISFFDEIEVESTPIKPEPELETITYKRKKRKNQRGLDLSSLPVRTEIHDLDDKTCPECGEELRKIGENKRKELIYHPARFEVVEHIQYVYTCDKCEETELKSPIYKCEIKENVIPKSFASPSLLATILDNKFNKALPLYRQEVMFKQNGLKLSRQTMANWMIKLYDLYFKKVTECMHEALLKSEYICADETTTQVLKVPNKKATATSYMWVYKTGRSEKRQIVVFIYESSRAHQHATNHLKDYHQIVQSDGYQAYDNLKDVTHMGCFAHARRKYVEALDGSPKGTDLSKTVSYQLLHKIDLLFKIEKETDKKSYDEIKAIRQEKAKPIVDEYFKEVKDAAKYAVGKTKLSIALNYSINQEDKLRTYLDDGRIEISNNRAENCIRPFCIGKKNWLFANTVMGAQTSAAMYSIIETAKLNHLKPEAYVEYLLDVFPEIDIENNEELMKYMPWSETLPKELYSNEKS